MIVRRGARPEPAPAECEIALLVIRSIRGGSVTAVKNSCRISTVCMDHAADHQGRKHHNDSLIVRNDDASTGRREVNVINRGHRVLPAGRCAHGKRNKWRDLQMLANVACHTCSRLRRFLRRNKPSAGPQLSPEIRRQEKPEMANGVEGARRAAGSGLAAAQTLRNRGCSTAQFLRIHVALPMGSLVFRPWHVACNRLSVTRPSCRSVKGLEIKQGR
jgi:hypothetical protein